MEYPDLLIEISEVRDLAEIEKITPVFIYPSLVVNDRLVCVGRFPIERRDTQFGFNKRSQDARKSKSDGQPI